MAANVLLHPGYPQLLIDRLQTQADPCAAPDGAVALARSAHAQVYAVGDTQPGAMAVANAFETDYNGLVVIFGIDVPGLPCTVYVEQGVGGAYHCGCEATTFFVDGDRQYAASFSAAELVEVFEAAMANGWDCGKTNGEALSRALAVALHPELAPQMVPTETGWWNNGQADYISTNDADDQNQDANGCGLLFLYYLHSGLDQGWDTIARAGGATLAQTYAALTNNDAGTAFSAFLAALQRFVDASNTLVLLPSGNPWVQ